VSRENPCHSFLVNSYCAIVSPFPAPDAYFDFRIVNCEFFFSNHLITHY
jgi:hypothetical protein